MEKLTIVRTEIERKEKLKKEMESRMSEAETLEYRVAYLRDIQKLQLYEIAERTGYAYSYVRKVSMKVPKLR